MNLHERMGTVAAARNLEGVNFDQEVAYDGPGKYECLDDRELGIAVWTIGLHGFQDELTPGGVRVGSVVVEEYDDGRLFMKVYGTPELAEEAVEKGYEQHSCYIV